MKRALAALFVAAIAGGCGPAHHAGGSGHATLWVTRNRGRTLLVAKTVPAGESAMDALRHAAKVETRYGGRFVQSIDGLAGSAARHHDWFYFVNGYEADRGAADYTLHAGDVEWWDYRAWTAETIHVPVVVGAFPEPFLHGYDGHRRPAIVASLDPARGRAVARRLHARSLDAGGPLPKNANILFIGPPLHDARFEARLRSGSSAAGAPVRMIFVGHLDDLFRGRYRRRYEVKP